MLVNEKIQMNVRMALDFAQDIARGISHLHAENIIHCDLGMCMYVVVNYLIIYAMVMCFGISIMFKDQ